MNWHDIVRATALALAVFVIIGSAGWFIYRASQWEAAYEVQSAEKSQSAYNSAREQMRQSCGPLPAKQRYDCERQIEDAHRQNQREIKDLEAQRVTALWTSYMGAAALLGMAVSIIGVGLVFFTFQASRKAADAARDTFDAFVAVERAALVATIDGGHTAPDGRGINFPLQVSNIGRSAAYIYHARFSALPDLHPGEFKGYLRIAHLIKDGQTISVDPGLYHDGDLGKMHFIGGYIEYESRFGKWHRSYFCFDLRTRKDEEWVYGGSKYYAVPAKPEDQWPKDT